MNVSAISRKGYGPQIRMLQIISCNLLLVLCSPVRYVGAQNVGPGEHRFNAAIYKGSHNSEERDESLAQQIDAYNVWQIELDIMDFEGDFKVPGDDCDPETLQDDADSLTTLLKNMQVESDPLVHQFTVIYLDMKGNGQEGCLYSWGSNINNRLKTTFQSSLSANSIYPSSVFVTKDASSWPSYQNLARRGYRWAVVVDWHDMTPPGADQDELFFQATSINPTGTAADPNWSPSTVLVNLTGGCDISPNKTQPGVRNQRWLYRAWPAGECSGDCQLMSGAYWSTAVSEGYNFVATNCINYSNTFDSPTHTADPLFVTIQRSTSCPNSYAHCDWGTQAFPFHDLGAALDRASPGVTVSIQNGIYQISRTDHPRLIKGPMNLAAKGGNVILK
jgi:hypothetical protein